MSERDLNTPITDSLRKLRTEGLNDQAAADLATMALSHLIALMPEHFDEHGEPYKNYHTVIATSHELYYRSPQ